MTIEKQAVRVAAAAAALVEDGQRPASPRSRPAEGLAGRKWWDPAEMVLGMIRDEQRRRPETWGDRRRSPLEWLLMLTVEVGALAAEIARAAPPDGDSFQACADVARAAESARRWLDGSGGVPPT